MDKKIKSSITDKTDGATKAEQTSILSRDAAPRRRANIKMVQNVLLVWLDSNIDNNNGDCRNTISQLRRVVNDISTFTDGEECMQFIESINDNKACMIISGSLGELIVPRVHNMSQVDSIFIFCGNKKHHEQWTQKWLKIKGVFTEIIPICDALKQAAQQCEQNSISMSFMSITDDLSDKKLDQLEPSFMYTQIMKEILLTIKFENKHFQEFLDYCRDVLADNLSELQNVDKLKEEYSQKTPIWWYTYECFLYPMLNRALRTLEADLIITLGFFIKDLHLQIEQLHNQQFSNQSSNTSFIVYRGQGMTKEEFEKMTKAKGGLLSFNCFLSTSKKRHVSLNFAERVTKNPNLVGIVFVMNIDPSRSTTPFAAINDVSKFGNREEEVLFSMHTVFRIQDITPVAENHRLFQVNLTLTSDNDPDLRMLTDRIREETFPDSEGWYRLALVLLEMGQPKKAEEVYHILLEKAITKESKAPIYHQIGRTKQDQKEHEEAIKYYEKALKINQKILPPDHPDLAISYTNIGNVYGEMGDYEQELVNHEQALTIKQQSLAPNDPDLASSYNNIGAVYYAMNKYWKALSYYEKAFEIFQKALPSNHPDLAASYDNLGLVYEQMGDYPKARTYYQRAVSVAQQSLTSNHPNLLKWKNNLDQIKKKL